MTTNLSQINIRLDTQIIKKQQELSDLKGQRQFLNEEFKSLTAELFNQEQDSFSPQQVYKAHIKRLKEYNELRDTGLRLVQMIADERSCKLKEIFDEMGQVMID